MPRNSHLFSIACLAILAVLVYAPGLSGGFEFDDEPNIVRNDQLLITELTPATLKQAAFSMRSGQLMRPVSYLTLALNHYLTGLDPFYFKLTNLLIHLLNGLAVYWLSRQLLIACRRQHQPALTPGHIHWISLLASAFWLLHPLGLTSVLYVVQRMNSLSALFVFLGLATYCQGRNRQNEGRHGAGWLLASVLIFTPLAILSKENGALLPFFILIAEITLFRFAMPEPKARRWLLTFITLVAILPALLVIGFLLTHTDWWLAAYNGRDFTLSERLLTQARVVWFYLAMTLVPNSSMLGLFHDDFALSSGILAPPATGLAIVGLAGLLVTAWFCRRRAPLVSFGLLFFLVGHSMESGIFALEMVHEHRNYLPMYGILLPLAYYLLHPSLSPSTARARIVLGVAFMSALGISTAIRANYWGNPLQLALVQARNHPGSARSQFRLGQIYWQLRELQPEHAARYTRLAREQFEKEISINPGSTSGLFALVMMDASLGLPLTKQVTELSQRLRFRPFASSSYNQLRDLGQCLASQRCRITADEINRIVAASLENPTLRGSTRARVLSEAMIIALLQGDRSRALKLGEEATRLNPEDAQHWLNYASLLIQSGQLEQADAILQTLDKRDLQPFLQPRLATQQKALREARRKPARP